jgi:hypothetical protein
VAVYGTINPFTAFAVIVVAVLSFPSFVIARKYEVFSWQSSAVLSLPFAFRRCRSVV